MTARDQSPPSSGRLSKLGVGELQQPLGRPPFEVQEEEVVDEGFAADSIWRARALRSYRDAAGSEARKAKNPRQGPAQTSESARVNTLAVRSLLARTPELSDEPRE